MIDTAAYGKALFDLAAELETDAAVYEELELVGKVLEENPGYVNLLDTPAVSTEEKLSLLDRAFSPAEPILRNFLSLLCEKRSVYRFPACAAAYGKAYDQAHNILRATAITAVPMTPEQCRSLTGKLEGLTGKTVILSNQRDEGLIGGMTLRYGGVQLDDSIRSRLDRLSSSLSQTIV